MAAAAAPKHKPAKPAAPGKRAVQAKLTVGAANDRFEHEADRAAQRIGSSALAPAAPPPTISGLTAQRQAVLPAAGPERRKDETAAPPEKRAQRAAAPDRKPGKASAKPPAKPAAKSAAQRKPAASGDKRPATPAAKLQRVQRDPAPGGEAVVDAGGEAVVDAGGGEAPAAVESTIVRLQQRPAPGLDPGTRGRVEAAVGSDLGGVRVHTDSAAAGAAEALGARAFTVGRDMFFGAGQYRPATITGQKLIAHEAAHTVQQRGGSAQAQRIQRAGNPKNKPPKSTAPVTKASKIEGNDWSVDVTPTKAAPKGGTIRVPTLALPKVLETLKGAANATIGPVSASGALPVEGQAFTRNPQAARTDREDGPAFEKWVEYMRSNASATIADKLGKQLQAQGNAAPMKNAAGQAVYVLKRKSLKSDSLDTLLVGTVAELAKHDGVLRPMLKRASGAAAEYDADHILEDQLGGLDTADNMWLLDRSYNRSVGSSIKAGIDASINKVLGDARAAADQQQADNNIVLEKPLPNDVQVVKKEWTLVFGTVTEGKFGNAPKDFWTRQDIKEATHLKLFAALDEKELARQGFKYDPDQKPTRINVYPDRGGGKATAFKVSDDGKSLQVPYQIFRGVYAVGDTVPFDPKVLATDGTVISQIEVEYQKKDKKKTDGSLVAATGLVDVRHDSQLGFGGYITRDSIRKVFANADFTPLSPIAFPDVGISPEGELVASGTVAATKALFPGLHVPITLRGTEIGMSFPLPTDKLSLGPVSVTDAAIELGVGDNGFFLQGSAGILVEGLGKGIIAARTEKGDVILAGDFMLDMDFLEEASLKVVYSLAKDDFLATATISVAKGALPGVDAGSVTITITRSSVAAQGSLALGGIMAGSTVTIGYAPETGLLIEGKDLPLPVGKLPGVSDAKLTVRAVRDPDTLAWAISGGGKAALSAGGASGTLDIMFDGTAVTFSGRVDVAKGPAKGWLEITGTNRATDEAGQPIENGPVGELHIWGKGEASIAFGKILTGTAGIEYTPDGRVIVAGEIALPPTYDLFPKQDLSPKQPLFHVAPPDFPIWGVKVGPVGFGIFAFVDASITAEAFVGPGQLRDAKVNAILDLDKPQEARVDGHAEFFVPSYAGLTLDVGGGVKAQVAVAFVKGRVGLYGRLGLGIDGSFGVDVHWNPTDGFAVGAEAKIVARPKFEIGVNASITAGVDAGLFEIDKTWGPWEKPLGSFGPDMALSATFPMGWSEKHGLDIDPGKIVIERPSLDAKAIMKDAFDMLV